MTALLLLMVGLALLLVGGTSMVRGASGVAAQFGVSPLLVGLTIVAFGTSAPELIVMAVSALRNETALAFGNVMGSNSANIGLILGITGIVSPIVMQGDLVRREVPLLLLATAVIFAMSADLVLKATTGVIDRSDASVLLLLFGGFLYVTVAQGIRAQEDPIIVGVQHLPVEPVLMRDGRNWLYVLAGTIGLAVGGNVTVTYAGELAQILALPSVVIGLLVVAVGTSLPELACSLIAAVKNEPDLCIGNIVGSNLCNGLLVLPVGALLRPIPIPLGGILDIWISLLFVIALLPIFIIGKARLGRPAGIVLLGGYVTYLIARAT